jgi:hypothetical protein
VSNWNGTSRSNYFRVKDVPAFKEWAESLDIQVFDNAEPDLFGISPSEYSDDGSWPTFRFGGEDTDDEYVDIEQELKAHLADGEVCVLISAGAEKLRYVTGSASAFDNTDRPHVHLHLSQIYQLAKDAFGVAPTDASY